MANLAWYPISPTLTDKGAFSAFAYDDNGKELKPIPLDAGADPFSQFRVLQSSFNIQVAANLGVQNHLKQKLFQKDKAEKELHILTLEKDLFRKFWFGNL